MEISNLLTVTTRKELREWLQDNHKLEKFCWVIVSIKLKEDILLYLDAVEEAICFGWIDGRFQKRSSLKGCPQELRKAHGLN